MTDENKKTPDGAEQFVDPTKKPIQDDQSLVGGNQQSVINDVEVGLDQEVLDDFNLESFVTQIDPDKTDPQLLADIPEDQLVQTVSLLVKQFKSKIVFKWLDQSPEESLNSTWQEAVWRPLTINVVVRYLEKFQNYTSLLLDWLQNKPEYFAKALTDFKAMKKVILDNSFAHEMIGLGKVDLLMEYLACFKDLEPRIIEELVDKNYLNEASECLWRTTGKINLDTAKKIVAAGYRFRDDVIEHDQEGVNFLIDVCGRGTNDLMSHGDHMVGEAEYSLKKIQHNEIYKRGIPISKSRDQGGWSDYPDELQGEIIYHDREFLQTCLRLDEQLSEGDQKEILDLAFECPAPFMKNIFEHKTKPNRAPIIAKTGLLSRELVDKLTQRRYGGKTVFSQGWGPAMEGRDYIDISDPYLRVINNEQQKGLQKEYEKEIETDLTTTISPELVQNKLSIKSQVGNGVGGYRDSDRQGPTFYIRIENPNKLVKKRFVKGRILPKELIGLTVNYGYLAEINDSINQANNQDQKRTANQVIEILGSNIKMPIYDELGNLVWPSKISREQLLEDAYKRQVQK